MRILMGGLDWGSEEKEALHNLIDQYDPQLTQGPKVEEFEKNFAQWIGSKYAIAVNSGTSALMVAISSYTIYKGIKVRNTHYKFASTSALTYPATWNAITKCGYLPIYTDTGQYSFVCYLEGMEHKDTLMVPVHLFGIPIKNLTKDDCMIEDAAQALGSMYRGKKLGTFGIAGIFSFYPSHQLTTIEGGMIVTDNKDMYHLSQSLRDNGRFCECSKCKDKPKDRWKTTHTGFNMKMTEMQAVIGLVKLRKLNDMCMRRHEIFMRYNEEFSSIPETKDEYIVPLGYPIITEDPQKAMRYLSRMGIDSRPMFPARYTSHCVYANHASQYGFYIPSHHKLTDEEVDLIISKVKEVLV